MVNRPALRLRLIIVLLILAPLGFASKFYQGPLQSWVNGSLGGALYEIFWCVLLFLVQPRWKPKHIALTVFLITAALEFLQLWRPPFLQWLRSFFLGRTLIGTTFIWSDFIYYIIGSYLGYRLLLLISNQKDTPYVGSSAKH